MVFNIEAKAKVFAREYYDLIFRRVRENDISLFEAVVLIVSLTEIARDLSFLQGKSFCDLILKEILNLSR